MDAKKLAALIRDVPDFPKPGIVFKDITTLVSNPEAFKATIDAFANRYRGQQIDKVLAIESRGFILGAPVAMALGIPFVPVRKAGKLPWDTIKASYELEYGTAEIEVHRDAFGPGERVVIIDDLLATGGTACAACELVEQTGAVVAGCGFLIELTFLNGAAKLRRYDFESLVRFGAGE